VTLATVEPRPTAVIARRTTWKDYPALWPRLLDEVYAFVRPRPELSPTPHGAERWRNVMLYRDRTPSVEVGVLAARPFDGGGAVVASELPGGTVATAVHHGDHARLGDTHDAISRFIDEQGLEHAGPLWEIYGHWREDPSELETEIYWLLR
jgi:effector-binding domain-containing protein